MVKLFGTDGIRGVANTKLTPELAFRLGYYAAEILANEADYEGEAGEQSVTERKPSLLIGRDTRISGDMLAVAFSAGAMSAGVSVQDVGVASTPAIAWLTRHSAVQAGVVISASHNPMQYNGIKFFAHSGYKLSDAVEEQIEAALMKASAADTVPATRPSGLNIGRSYRAEGLMQGYLDSIERCVAERARLDGMRIALDCANGAVAAYAITPFERLGADVHLLHHQPNGANINAACGSTHPESLQEFMKTNRFDLGLAFDGDADRCLAVDSEGNLVDGDQFMAILALMLHERKELAQNTLVTTVMSNLGLHQAMTRYGLKIVRTKVGDRYVIEEMLNRGCTLGGEQSGHIIIGSISTTGDGLLAGLLLAARMKLTGATLKDLAGVVTLMPQVLHNVQLQDIAKVFEAPCFIEAIQRAEYELGENGRILVRPSGTEPLLRIMVEAQTVVEAEQIANELAAIAKQIEAK